MTPIEQLTAKLDAAQRERDEWREHAAASDKEFCQLSDWLIGNAEFDPKTGLIDQSAKLKERIRDLVAAECELAQLRATLAKHHAHSLETCEVAFVQDGKPIDLITDLGEAYAESELCSETINALSARSTPNEPTP